MMTVNLKHLYNYHKHISSIYSNLKVVTAIITGQKVRELYLKVLKHLIKVILLVIGRLVLLLVLCK